MSRVIRRGLEGLAIIDITKKAKEEGQYVFYDAQKTPDMNVAAIVSAARMTLKEIRYYYREMLIDPADPAGEKIPAKLIITEIPPSHVQTFHVHETIHETTLVVEGELVACESENLTERDWAEIVRTGKILSVGDVLVEEPGKRHTVMNRDPDRYCHITTYQVSRTLTPDQFKADWVRRDPVQSVKDPATASATTPPPAANPKDARAELTEAEVSDVSPNIVLFRKRRTA